jgi:hypothetical protein
MSSFVSICEKECEQPGSTCLEYDSNLQKKSILGNKQLATTRFPQLFLPLACMENVVKGRPCVLLQQFTEVVPPIISLLAYGLIIFFPFQNVAIVTLSSSALVGYMLRMATTLSVPPTCVSMDCLDLI